MSDGLLKVQASDTSEHLWATCVACAGKVGVTRIAALNGENSPSFHLGQVLIVICDWNMPGIAGIDVLRRVRAAAAQLEARMRIVLAKQQRVAG